jgi:hypothetical protein
MQKDSETGRERDRALSDECDEILFPTLQVCWCRPRIRCIRFDHVFDDRNGPGGMRWIAGEVGEQTIILAFDRPQRL